MPRNMSFNLTTEQFKNRTKTVTRRKGWKFLKPGDIVMGCMKCQGLKPGEQIDRLGLIRIVWVTREPLHDVDIFDVWKEGFTTMGAEEFITMFCDHMGGERDQTVTRIEFEYVD